MRGVKEGRTRRTCMPDRRSPQCNSQSRHCTPGRATQPASCRRPHSSNHWPSGNSSTLAHACSHRSSHRSDTRCLCVVATSSTSSCEIIASRSAARTARRSSRLLFDGSATWVASAIGASSSLAPRSRSRSRSAGWAAGHRVAGAEARDNRVVVERSEGGGDDIFEDGRGERCAGRHAGHAPRRAYGVGGGPAPRSARRLHGLPHLLSVCPLLHAKHAHPLPATESLPGLSLLSDQPHRLAHALQIGELRVSIAPSIHSCRHRLGRLCVGVSDVLGLEWHARALAIASDEPAGCHHLSAARSARVAAAGDGSARAVGRCRLTEPRHFARHPAAHASVGVDDVRGARRHPTGSKPTSADRAPAAAHDHGDHPFERLRLLLHLFEALGQLQVARHTPDLPARPLGESAGDTAALKELGRQVRRLSLARGKAAAVLVEYLSARGGGRVG
eukprot:scaffold30262_cov96-Isochrysis_galbana.AAC.7